MLRYFEIVRKTIAKLEFRYLKDIGSSQNSNWVDQKNKDSYKNSDFGRCQILNCELGNLEAGGHG